MSWLYRTGKCAWGVAQFFSIRRVVLHAERAKVSGGCVLACTHLGNLEPVFVGLAVGPQIHWLTRIEFYRKRINAFGLELLDAIPVDRSGVPVRAMRTAIDRARRGAMIGIFPEGGLPLPDAEAIFGGPIKRGACVIAQRAKVPIVPAAITNSTAFGERSAFLPFRRVRYGVNFGLPLQATANVEQASAERELLAALEAAMSDLYAELSAESVESPVSH